PFPKRRRLRFTRASRGRGVPSWSSFGAWTIATARSPRSFRLRPVPRDPLQHVVGIEGLHDMVVDARLAALADVVVASVARDRDDQDVSRARIGAKPP